MRSIYVQLIIDTWKW